VRGVLASGGLAIAGAIVRWASLIEENAAPGRRSLTEDEETITRALIEALLPSGGEMPAANPAIILPRLDAWLSKTDPEGRFLFRAMLHVIEDQSILLRLKRFSKLSLEERMEEVRAWERTPIYPKRMAFSTVKLFIGLQYFEQPGVHQSIGWYVGCSPSQLSQPSEEDGLG
jgi:hypothetical protein